MTLEEIQSYINGNNIDKLKTALQASKDVYFIGKSIGYENQLSSTGRPYTYEDDVRQYNPKTHDVHSLIKRPNKTINSEGGGIEKIISVTRLSVPEQKKIVLMAATFLGSPELSSNPVTDIEKNMLNVINAIFEENKLDYKFKQIAKHTMSERECAELWYTQTAEPDYYEGTPMAGAKFKLRLRVLAPSLGDTLFPVYDSYGDMVAFGRYYEVMEVVAGSSELKKICHFDIYTKERFYYMQKEEGSTEWVHVYDPVEIKDEEGNVTKTKGLPNVMKKIPVIYYSQPATEWADVQEMIDRLEKKISNHGDTNDYYDSPIVVASGDVVGFANKGESGKLLEAKNGASVEYLTWDNAPESMKMEINNLKEFINKYTHTPDISFDNVKALGTFSGIALKMFFMDAHLKASDKEEIFGQAVQRRINYLKNAVAVLKQELKPAVRLSIKPIFNYFLPKDIDGEVDTIVKAYEAGIISLETAVKLNPLVQDAVNELELIRAEQAATTPETGTPGTGGGVTETLGKIPLALQQLSLAASRAQDAGDSALADKLNGKINELLKTI